MATSTLALVSVVSLTAMTPGSAAPKQIRSAHQVRVHPAMPGSSQVRPAAEPVRDMAAAASGEVVEAPAPPEAFAPQAAPAAPARTVWDDLADCESGDWTNGVPQQGSARWDYGLTFSHGDNFQGGLNFAPSTWDAYRDPDMPGHAGEATREQQIAVAERVLADQGWRAWPVCSRKLGLR